MAEWAIVALGIPLGTLGIIFGWLFSRNYLKVLTKRHELKAKELGLKEREISLREKQADREFELHEKDLDYKFKMLESESKN